MTCSNVDMYQTLSFDDCGSLSKAIPACYEHMDKQQFANPDYNKPEFRAPWESCKKVMDEYFKRRQIDRDKIKEQNRREKEARDKVDLEVIERALQGLSK